MRWNRCPSCVFALLTLLAAVGCATPRNARVTLACPPKPPANQMPLASICAVPYPPLPQPTTIASAGGQLNLSLTETTMNWLVCVDDTGVMPGATASTFTARVYADANGPSFIPSVWTLGAGDTINVALTNQLPTSTNTVGLRARRAAARNGIAPRPQSTSTEFSNLHFHGFSVDPDGPTPGQQPFGDNVFVQVKPGDPAAQYSVKVHDDQSIGMHWFHPHPHGFSELDVLSGLSGVAIVGNLANGLREKFFLLKDVDPTGLTPAPPHLPNTTQLLKTINGFTKGSICINQNEQQLWDFANAGADAFFDLEIVDDPPNRPSCRSRSSRSTATR